MKKKMDQPCTKELDPGSMVDMHTYIDAWAPTYQGVSLDDAPLVHVHRGTPVYVQLCEGTVAGV